MNMKQLTTLRRSHRSPVGSRGGEADYDLVVVGGGIAGASLAALTARDGARTLVLEREQAFRDRVRGEWLAPWGVEEARAMGLEAVFHRAGAHVLPALAGRSGKPRPVASPGGTVPLSFSHPAVQEALLEVASDSGAMVRRGARVTAVGAGGEVRYLLDGHERTVRARLVVGADGRSSLVRAALGRECRVHRSSRLLAGVRLGGLGGDPALGYFIVRDDIGGLVSIFPQGGGFGRAYVFRNGNDAGTYTGPRGLERFLADCVALGIPEGVVAGACAAGPLASFTADDTWVERPAGKSMALIGDAAGISDPTWGMGISLALRDARTLAAALRASVDWDVGAAAYAVERDRYYGTVVTAENWQSELQLAVGPEADQRRKHALGLWSKDPSRAVDLPGLGPAIDASEAARIRFFGEDVPVASLQPALPAIPPAEAFLHALSARDFDALASLFSPTMRTRALLPGGPVELHGVEPTVAAFVGWFRDVEDFTVLETGHEAVVDRLRLSWRFSLRWPGESHPRVIEQIAYAKLVDDRIGVLDILCSGFRPHPAAALERAAA